MFNSAEGLLDASRELSAHPRSAEMLRRHAKEEISKILILIDLVRCPIRLRSTKVKAMIKWFYDHLARLIYLEAQSWKPVDVKQLQEYADNSRRSHYLEGSVGEYIMPNWELYMRESDLYADIECDHDGNLFWNDPQSKYTNCESDFCYFNLQSWEVCSALKDFGAFSREGLDIISKVWSEVCFSEKENYEDAKELTFKMATLLQEVRLISDHANQSQLSDLYHKWQLPMYCIDFSRIEVPLDDLRDAQERSLMLEMGY